MELIRYSAGSLPEDVADRVESHLAECPACDATVAGIDASADTLLASVAQAFPDDPLLAEPELAVALDRVEALGVSLSNPIPHRIGHGQVLPQQDLGAYELIARLGQGGMGTVYQARHKRLGKLVALKLLPPERLQDPESLRRFEREMRAVGKLNHPHIVSAFDAGEASGQHYLVMELVDGLTLATIADCLARDGGIGVADACELIRQAAVGLQHAHERGLVHRDVKPSNLMLGVGGSAGTPQEAAQNDRPVVKILDFGLALLDEHLGERGDLTNSGLVMGTVDYMAPEQASDSHDVDIRADLYSLGATLFRLLTGDPPIPGGRRLTPLKQMFAKSFQPAPSLASRREDLPPGLIAIVDRLLATQPGNRFQTPGELAVALRPFASSANLRALLDRAIQRQSAANQQTATSRGNVTVHRATAPHRPTITSGEFTGSQRPASALQSTRRSVDYTRRVLLAAGAALLIVAAVVTYRIATDQGELTITSSEPSVEVTIRRNGQVVQNLEVTHGQAKTRVRTGQIEVLIQGANTDTLVATSDQTGRPTFTLSRGGKAVVEITRQAAKPTTSGAKNGSDADRRAAAWVLSIGGKIKVSTASQGEIDVWDLSALPAGPLELTWINLDSNRTIDQSGGSGLDQLQGLNSLTYLDLSQTNVGDAGLAKLERLPALTHLHLMLSQVGDPELAHLRKFDSLTHLNLDYTRIGDEGLVHLSGLSKLTTLQLCGTGVSDTGLVQLASLARLTELRLDHTTITNAGMRHLKSLTNLHRLDLQRTAVGDEGLEYLNGLTKLELLSLSGTKVSDAGLAHLAEMSHLNKLYLSFTSVSDRGLAHLKHLPQLMQLGLRETQVSDAGLATIGELTNLTSMDLTGSRVTAAGVRKLQSIRPSLDIRFIPPQNPQAD